MVALILLPHTNSSIAVRRPEPPDNPELSHIIPVQSELRAGFVGTPEAPYLLPGCGGRASGQLQSGRSGSFRVILPGDSPVRPEPSFEPVLGSSATRFATGAVQYHPSGR